MAFKTKVEKYAYVKGLKKGQSGGKPYGEKKKLSKSFSGEKSTSDNPFGMSYYEMLRENKARKRSLMGDDFERDSRGRIKGSYTPNGFFEPD